MLKHAGEIDIQKVDLHGVCSADTVFFGGKHVPIEFAMIWNILEVTVRKYRNNVHRS